MIDAEDIRTICATVREFSDKADWRWKGMPVVSYEFPTIDDFARARWAILRAATPMVHEHSDWQRIKSPDTLEIDCMGVTFRLVCQQVVEHPQGRPTGAAEIIWTSLEEHEARLAERRRRQNWEFLDA